MLRGVGELVFGNEEVLRRFGDEGWEEGVRAAPAARASSRLLLLSSCQCVAVQYVSRSARRREREY